MFRSCQRRKLNYQHNVVEIQVTEHLVPVLKDCFSDSAILLDVNLGRATAVNIIKNVDLTTIFRKNRFSSGRKSRYYFV